MPSLRSALTLTSCAKLTEPATAVTDFPLRSSIVLMPRDFLAAKRVALRKCVLVKVTCFWRSALLVVAEQCRSIVPLTIRGMRFDEVTGR